MNKAYAVIPLLVFLYAYIALRSFRERKKIFAIAKHTFVETIRKKTWLVLIIFALILILNQAARFFPVIRALDRLNIVESVCLWSITTIGMIVALFASAVAIPADLTDRTIYSVMTKPVTRSAYVTGRVLGFGFLSLSFLVIMGFVGLVTIHLSVDDPSRLIARRIIPESTHYFLGGGLELRNGTPWIFHDKAGPVRWRIEDIPELEEGQEPSLEIRLHVTSTEGKGPIPVAIELENDQRRKNRFQEELPDGKEVSIPLDAKYLAGGGGVDIVIVPINEGDALQPDLQGVGLVVDEKRYRSVECKPLSATWPLWHFTSLPGISPEDEIGICIKLPVSSSESKDEIPCIVTLRNAAGRMWPGRANITGSRTTEITVSASFLGEQPALTVAIMPEKMGDGFAALKDGVWVRIRDRDYHPEDVQHQGIGLSPKRYITWITQGPQREAVFEFRGLKKRDLPATQVFGIAELHIGGGARTLPIKLKAINPADPEIVSEHELTLEVKRVRETTAKPLQFELDGRTVSDDGRLTIEISRLDPGASLGVPDEQPFKLYARPGSYYGNFIKALCIVFFQFFLIIAIAVMGSTFLSWPVSILFSLFFFICGYLIEFMRNASVLLAPPRALVMHGEYHEHWLHALFRNVVENVLYLASFVLPDFRTFKVSHYVIEKLDIELYHVACSLCYMAVYVGLAIIIGQVIFSKREMD